MRSTRVALFWTEARVTSIILKAAKMSQCHSTAPTWLLTKMISIREKYMMFTSVINDMYVCWEKWPTTKEVIVVELTPALFRDPFCGWSETGFTDLWIIHVKFRFHMIDVVWNPGLMWNAPNSCVYQYCYSWQIQCNHLLPLAMPEQWPYLNV